MNTKQKFKSIGLGIAAAIAIGSTSTLLSVSTWAHHAFAAEFDADKPFSIQGEVTKIKWVNPHSWLYFDVKDKDGTVTNWGVEFGTPNQLANKGLAKSDVSIGTLVKIKGFLAKNGSNSGYSVTLTLPDGRTIQTGGAQDVPETPATAALAR